MNIARGPDDLSPRVSEIKLNVIKKARASKDSTWTGGMNKSSTRGAVDADEVSLSLAIRGVYDYNRAGRYEDRLTGP